MFSLNREWFEWARQTKKEEEETQSKMPSPPTDNKSSLAKDSVEVIGFSVASTVACTKGAGLALSGIGFTKVGVAAKSFAAIYQASIGNVVAGSFFSGLQSVGATGIAILGPVGLGAAMIGGGGLTAYKIQQAMARQREEERRKMEEEERRKKEEKERRRMEEERCMQLCERFHKLIWSQVELGINDF